MRSKEEMAKIVTIYNHLTVQVVNVACTIHMLRGDIGERSIGLGSRCGAVIGYRSLYGCWALNGCLGLNGCWALVGGRKIRIGVFVNIRETNSVDRLRISCRL